MSGSRRRRGRSGPTGRRHKAHRGASSGRHLSPNVQLSSSRRTISDRHGEPAPGVGLPMSMASIALVPARRFGVPRRIVASGCRADRSGRRASPRVRLAAARRNRALPARTGRAARCRRRRLPVASIPPREPPAVLAAAPAEQDDGGAILLQRRRRLVCGTSEPTPAPARIGRARAGAGSVQTRTTLSLTSTPGPCASRRTEKAAPIASTRAGPTTTAPKNFGSIFPDPKDDGQ